MLPSLTMLLRTMEAGSSGRLVVDSVCNIGPHYARTLREWRRRFIGCFETVVVPALKAEHPTVMNGACGAEEIEVFKRKWLCKCQWHRIRLALSFANGSKQTISERHICRVVLI